MSTSGTTARPPSRRSIATAVCGGITVLSVAAALVAASVLYGVRDDTSRTKGAIPTATAGAALAAASSNYASGVPDADRAFRGRSPAQEEPAPTF